MNHEQASKVRIRTHTLIMFIDGASRKLNKQAKNSSAKGGCSMLPSTLLIKTMSLLEVFRHSNSSK